MDGVKVKENIQKALELYYESAEKGNAFSQLQLGKMFLQGVGVERDYQAALEWIQKSAEQGNGEAQAYLGQLHEQGLGVGRNIQKALELYKKSAMQGNAFGQARLASFYLTGTIVEANPREALAWYQKAAEQGNDEAQANLGHMYEKGQAVNRDIQKAADLYKKSAEQDNALGQLRLGDFYLNGLGVEQRPRKAFAWYQKAAAQDKDPEIASQAQQRLAAMYCQGNGVEKDLKKGFEFYEMAARLDNAEAQFCLGAMYEDGVGVERDHKKALEWFQKSSKKSKAPSDRAMGDIYRDGLIVEKNIPEAIKWYKKAADEGDANAKTELLKLQLEESAQKKAQAAPAPAGREDARAAAAVAQPARAAAEKPRGKVEEKPARTAEKADLPARGKLQPAQPPKIAKLRTGKKIPEKTVQQPAPKQAGQAEKAHAPKKLRVAFSAIAMTVVALTAVFIGLGNKSGPILESLELKAAEITALPRPDPGSIPPLAMAPAGDFLKRINANKTSFKKSPAPIVEAARPVVRTEPAATRLRQEYTSLDEGEVAKMLAARNMFDAERNPGGSFPHRYEIKTDSGLRLIVDRATNLVWTRQQNPVRMNLKKSMDWIASLNNVAYGGVKNWRLPTIEEAASLLKKDGGKTFLDAIFGEGITAIWTGDGFSDSESWIVDFQNGTADHAKNKSRLVIVMVSSSPQ